MKTIEEKKEGIVKYIDYLTDKQIEFIFALTNFSEFPNKKDLMNLAGITEDEQRHIDTATPIDYFRRIEEIYPNFKYGNMVYDYNEPNNFGTMLNVNDLVVHKLLGLKRENSKTYWEELREKHGTKQSESFIVKI